MRTQNKVRSRKEVRGLRVALGVEKEKKHRRIYMEKWFVKVKSVINRSYWMAPSFFLKQE